VAVDLRIGEAPQKLPCSAGVIQMNVREKDAVDGADAQFIEPLNEVRDGGGRSRIDQERRPANPAYPGADELPEALEGLIDVDQVKTFTNLLNAIASR
jgi:hypothetical protein